jgi:hypothetical protein
MISATVDGQTEGRPRRKKPSNLAIRGLNPPKEKVEETTCIAAPALEPVAASNAHNKLVML